MWSVGRAVGALVLVCALTACTYAPEPSLLKRDDRPVRSQATVDEVVGSDTNPGCAAAVGEQGRAIWEGQRGLAVLEPATPITADTTFDIGSISMQFTALAVALLAEDGRLALDDTVADHLDGYPDWAETITIDQLVHHTSGLPEIETLLQAQGVQPTTSAAQEDLLAAIAAADRLRSEPGSHWAYSSADYLLLAAIVEQVTGRSLGDHLQQVFFGPLDLAMTLGWPGPADRTRSYRGSSQGRFVIDDVAWEAPGPVGIRSSPTELVRWGDVYRTGAVGGTLVTEPERGAVAGAWDDSRYGLGIMIAPDHTVWHDGTAGSFHSLFGVSADRTIAIAVTCNSAAINSYDILGPLVEIWDPA